MGLKARDVIWRDFWRSVQTLFAEAARRSDLMPALTAHLFSQNYVLGSLMGHGFYQLRDDQGSAGPALAALIRHQVDRFPDDAQAHLFKAINEEDRIVAGLLLAAHPGKSAQASPSRR